MEEMEEYDVHFEITGFYTVEAEDEESARERVNSFIGERINQVENILFTVLAEPTEEYVTDVLNIKRYFFRE